MGWKATVLGAGMQGTAAAYDLLAKGGASEVRILDQDEGQAVAAADRINGLVGGRGASGAWVDARDGTSLSDAIRGSAGVLSALPYALNPKAAAAAVQAQAHFCDLGGNTDVVRATLRLDDLAKARGVSVVPDCGLAPGLGNVLGTLAVERLRRPKSVRIRCGGLPQDRSLPLGYKLVFHVGGLTNEYTGEAECLREGRIVKLPTLSEAEDADFPPPIGVLEAFTTSGGTSTACEHWKGRLSDYEYKTLRYKGHLAAMRGFLEMGLFGTAPVRVGEAEVVPRELFHVLAGSAWNQPHARDLVVLRVHGQGHEPQDQVVFELIDHYDAKTGFTAMERTTAYPAAATLELQVRGRIPPGTTTPERGVPAQELLEMTRARGLAIAERRVL